MVDLGQHVVSTILIAVALPLVVVGELACLCRNPLEEIVDKRVHDAHGLGGHASVGVNLLQHLQN